MYKTTFADFLTQRSDEIDNAAFLLAATLTSEKHIFAVPGFLSGPNTSWETLGRKIAECDNEYVVTRDLLTNVIKGAIDTLDEQDIEVNTSQGDPYVLWAAFELVDALVSSGTDTAVETVFSYDIDDTAIEWDMSFIGDIVDAAAGAVEKAGLLPCVPFYEGSDETPCNRCKVSDCQRRVHLQCPLLPEQEEVDMGETPTPEQQDAEKVSELLRRDKLCFECDAEGCAFNPKGICKFPMVYGVEPEWNDHDGCRDMLLARDAFEE